MTFPLFPRLVALGLFVLTSGVLHAASKDSDAFPKTARASSPARLLDPDLFPDNDFAQKPGPVFVVNPPQEEEDLDQDPLLLELMRERDAALKKAKDAEKKVASQTRLIELMREKEAAEKKARDAEVIAADQARQIEEMKSKAKPPVKQEPASASIPRPLDIAIPEVARGYEDIYRRFLGGKLIYTDPSSKAKKELPIRALANPLEGTFDLSGCGDTGTYLSISTGYRKAQKAENASKVEIWLATWVLVTVRRHARYAGACTAAGWTGRADARPKFCF